MASVKTAVIAASALVLAAGGTAAYLLLGDAEPATAATTVEVERGDVSLTASASGTVAAARSWSLGFETEAEVTEVNVAAGDVVAEGDVLAAIDDTEASEDVDDAQTALDEAEDELDEAETDASEAESCETAAAATDQAAMGGQTGTSCDTSSGTDAILTAQQRLNQAEADLEDAEAALDATVITAPADGTVMSVSASEGTVLAAGTALIEFADLSSVTVAADFAEADAAALTVGQAVTVTFGDDPAVDAQVGAIDLVGTATDSLVTYGVTIGLAEAPEDALAGSTATVTVVLDSAPDTLWVPAAALQDIDGDTATAVVVNDDGTTETRDVVLGLRGDDGVAIASGLGEGDTVSLGTD
ncbi:efflux RND transporter periplasmic adaptor subunit [Glycomyces dulcitolivorans]|uniref:efflux RND transporter periplasmic adaptor subunit n=1 Tax=Glycomyces dulcitolivorans TaxID=2200759 RepID=UPI000DD4DAE4|nr:efflux RND transporter periplasmic adaptor subunit [Glycomyces dulcitolivorans]